jgi:hypothetical protein
MLNYLKIIKCKECHKKACARNFLHPVWCRWIETEEEEFVASLIDEYFTTLTYNSKNIWFKELVIFVSNRADLEEQIQKNRNIKAMLKVMAEIELNYKFAMAENELDIHYREAKKFYTNLFGESENDLYTIKVIYNDSEILKI